MRHLAVVPDPRMPLRARLALAAALLEQLDDVAQEEPAGESIVEAVRETIRELRDPEWFVPYDVQARLDRGRLADVHYAVRALAVAVDQEAAT